MQTYFLNSKKTFYSSHIILTYNIRANNKNIHTWHKGMKMHATSWINLQKHYTEEKKPGTREDFLYDATYMKFWNRHKN